MAQAGRGLEIPASNASDCGVSPDGQQFLMGKSSEQEQAAPSPAKF